MKTYLRYTLLCLFALSSALCRAGVTKIEHNFQSLITGGKISFNTPLNTIGVTDSVTYTCSGGAKFFKDDNTGYTLAIYLDKSGAQVTTTKIHNLDSLWIQYAPDAYKEMTVAISTDSAEWKNVVLDKSQNSIRKAKLTQPGDYYVRIAYKSSHNVYIKRIEYYCLDLSGCPNCFLYKPE